MISLYEMDRNLLTKIVDAITQFNQQYNGPIKANYNDGFIHEIYTSRKYITTGFHSFALLPDILNDINNMLKDIRIYEFTLQTTINTTINIEDHEPHIQKFDFDNFDIVIETGLFAASASICYDSINNDILRDLLTKLNYNIVNMKLSYILN